jgi:hypothetical protein
MFAPMTPMTERTYAENQNARLNTYRPGRPQRSLLELLKALRPKTHTQRTSRPMPVTTHIPVQG